MKSTQRNPQVRTRNARSQRGQGMMEYVIIVALVAIAAIAAYTWFGHTLQEQVSAVAYGLAGDGTKSTAASKTADTDAGTSETKAKAAVGLANFGNGATTQ